MGPPTAQWMMWCPSIRKCTLRRHRSEGFAPGRTSCCSTTSSRARPIVHRRKLSASTRLADRSAASQRGCLAAARPGTRRPRIHPEEGAVRRPRAWVSCKWPSWASIYNERRIRKSAPAGEQERATRVAKGGRHGHGFPGLGFEHATCGRTLPWLGGYRPARRWCRRVPDERRNHPRSDAHDHQDGLTNGATDLRRAYLRRIHSRAVKTESPIRRRLIGPRQPAIAFGIWLRGDSRNARVSETGWSCRARVLIGRALPATLANRRALYAVPRRIVAGHKLVGRSQVLWPRTASYRSKLRGRSEVPYRQMAHSRSSYIGIVDGHDGRT